MVLAWYKLEYDTICGYRVELKYPNQLEMLIRKRYDICTYLGLNEFIEILVPFVVVNLLSIICLYFYPPARPPPPPTLSCICFYSI